MQGEDDSRELLERWVEVGQVIRRLLGDRRFELLVQWQETTAESVSAPRGIAESYTDP